MGLQNVIQVVGGLGVFLYGMKLMSESLQTAAGEGLKRMLDRMTATRLAAVLSGTAMTMTIQSSSATTVMVVGFVNAALLTLRQAIGVIMGANIGTTFTAWLVALLGFKLKIATFALPAVAIGVVFLFTSRDRLVAWGGTLVGFGLLFLGLEFLKDGVPDISGNSPALQVLQQYSNMGFGSILLFVLVGTVLTVVVQSSSATSAITITLAIKGYIQPELAAAMLLGENIGTTITANLAALAGNLNAKKAALAHTLFNIIGVCWVLTIFPWAMQGLTFITQLVTGVDPERDRTAMGIYISIFHSGFNITNTLLLVWFVPGIERAVNFIGDRFAGMGTKRAREFQLLGAGSVRATGLSLLEVTEYHRASTLRTLDLFGHVDRMLRERFRTKDAEAIFAAEEELDGYRTEMLAFLTEIQESGVQGGQAVNLLATMEGVRILEQIGDHFSRVTRKLRRADKRHVELTKRHQEIVVEHLDLLQKQFALARAVVEDGATKNAAALNETRQLRFEIKKMLRETEQRLQKSKQVRTKKELRSAMLCGDTVQILDRLSHDLNSLLDAEH